jgi:hypothetical protein
MVDVKKEAASFSRMPNLQPHMTFMGQIAEELEFCELGSGEALNRFRQTCQGHSDSVTGTYSFQYDKTFDR